jgi:DNA-binding XRE family transcriptional regulator
MSGTVQTRTDRLLKETWQPRFLKAYEELGTVTHAATAAGVARSTVYQVEKNDPEFAAAFEEAREAAADRLERVAIQRAEETSDTLLIFLLKALRPEKYRENVRVEHSGALSLNEVLFADALPVESVEDAEVVT